MTEGLPFCENNKTFWRDKFTITQSLIDQMYADWEKVYWDGMEHFDIMHDKLLADSLIKRIEQEQLSTLSKFRKRIQSDSY